MDNLKQTIKKLIPDMAAKAIQAHLSIGNYEEARLLLEEAIATLEELKEKLRGTDAQNFPLLWKRATLLKWESVDNLWPAHYLINKGDIYEHRHTNSRRRTRR